MISKLIVHGTDRKDALAKLGAALSEYHIGGLNTNINFVTKCINNKQFKEGGVTTNFIEENETELLRVETNQAARNSMKSAALYAAVKAVESLSSRSSVCILLFFSVEDSEPCS